MQERYEASFEGSMPVTAICRIHIAAVENTCPFYGGENISISNSGQTLSPQPPYLMPCLRISHTLSPHTCILHLCRRCQHSCHHQLARYLAVASGFERMLNCLLLRSSHVSTSLYLEAKACAIKVPIYRLLRIIESQ